ncbi:MAG: site-specific DNA-methyltransferase [Armatimonadetes bacterium]|nr:site-specific DNA-methyltransferase [Armatimonadota bacterium]
MQSLPPPYYSSQGITLYHGDCLELLPLFPEEHFDMVFADPPYHLSNDGITCHAGKMVSVNKGEWDRSRGAEADHEFVLAWLDACRRVMKPDATIWVSGTQHIIYSVGFAMQKLGFRILNDIVWYKVNPPPNLACRYFTHSTEIVLWAAKSKKSKYTFNYEEMKQTPNLPFDDAGRQMKSIWAIKPPDKTEKTFGKHPTQKPVRLLNRIIRASTRPGDLVLDPFVGSGTTALSALITQRQCVGFDLDPAFLRTAAMRLQERAVHKALSRLQ